VVVLKGELRGAKGQAEIIVESMMTIDEAKEKFPLNCREVHVKLSTAECDDALIESLKEVFERYEGGTEICIYLEDAESGGNYIIKKRYLSEYSESFMKDVETALGNKGSVKLHYAQERSLAAAV
jgi:hypothetical protein